MSELDDALARLERAAAEPSPAQKERGPKAPVVVATTTPVRDADHRILYTIMEMADGRVFKQTPVRDADHRTVEVIWEQISRADWTHYDALLAKAGR